MDADKGCSFLLFTMQAWLSRYSITSTSDRLSVAPACSCFRVTFREVGDILDRVCGGGTVGVQVHC